MDATIEALVATPLADQSMISLKGLCTRLNLPTVGTKQVLMNAISAQINILRTGPGAAVLAPVQPLAQPPMLPPPAAPQQPTIPPAPHTHFATAEQIQIQTLQNQLSQLQHLQTAAPVLHQQPQPAVQPINDTSAQLAKLTELVTQMVGTSRPAFTQPISPAEQERLISSILDGSSNDTPPNARTPAPSRLQSLPSIFHAESSRQPLASSADNLRDVFPNANGNDASLPTRSRTPLASTPLVDPATSFNKANVEARIAEMVACHSTELSLEVQGGPFKSNRILRREGHSISASLASAMHLVEPIRNLVALRDELASGSRMPQQRLIDILNLIGTGLNTGIGCIIASSTFSYLTRKQAVDTGSWRNGDHDARVHVFEYRNGGANGQIRQRVASTLSSSAPGGLASVPDTPLDSTYDGPYPPVSASCYAQREGAAAPPARKRSIPTGPPTSADASIVICYNCNEPGHYSRECKAPATKVRAITNGETGTHHRDSPVYNRRHSRTPPPNGRRSPAPKGGGRDARR